MCCDVLGVVGSNLNIFKPEPTTPNMSQHIATRWPNARNMLRPTMLRYVAMTCCDRLAGALKEDSEFYLVCFTFSPGQTIATCQRNMSQHCWAQHFACVWPPCCDVLGVDFGNSENKGNLSNYRLLKRKPSVCSTSLHFTAN